MCDVCITVKLGHRLGHAKDNRKLPKRVPLGLFSTLEDLNFANGLVLQSHIHQHNQGKTNRLQADAQQVGLRISTEKTETMTLMWKCLLMVRSGNKNYTR